MDARQKEQLRTHREDIVQELVDSGRLPDVIYELQEAGVISSHNSLLETETTKSQKVKALLRRLEASEAPDCFQQFLEVLFRLDMAELVQRLDLSVYQQHRGSISGESEELEDLHHLPHLSFPSVDQTLPKLPQPPLAGPVPDQDNQNNNPQRPLHIQVTPYTFRRGMHYPEDEVYPNSSKPRGLVFLANYKDFRDNEHPTRHGSEKDTKNLVMLFSQMGYQVTKPHINLTKGETLSALRDFRGQDKLGQVDSCLVVIMSHGHDHRSFYTSDNLYMPVNEVVDNFNNRACPLLRGKPKIFIFQYCRGVGQDVGVVPAPLRNVNNTRGLTVETDSARFGEVIARDPTFSDMYIVYSTIEGYASFRHPDRGSWLIEALCTVFMEHSWHLELGHLMKMVSKKVSSNYTDDGNKQMCELVQKGFDKHFFFNPEPLEGMWPSMSSLGVVLSESVQRLRSPNYRPCLRPRSRSNSPRPHPGSRPLRTRHWSGASAGSEHSLDDPEEAQHSNFPHRRSSLPALATPTSPLYPSVFLRSSREILGVEATLLEDPEPAGCGQDICGQDINSNMQVWEAGASLDRVDHHTQWLSGALGEEGATALPPVSPGSVGGRPPCYAKVDEEMGLPAGKNSFKRQLSVHSTKEVLEKLNDVKTFLQVHDADKELQVRLERVESFVNKKKTEGKRRKVDNTPLPNSMDY